MCVHRRSFLKIVFLEIGCGTTAIRMESRNLESPVLVGFVSIWWLDLLERFYKSTSTDSNGFYGFNIGTREDLLLEFDAGDYEFTRSNFGFEDLDSDVDPITNQTGMTEVQDGLPRFGCRDLSSNTIG